MNSDSDSESGNAIAITIAVWKQGIKCRTEGHNYLYML